MVDFSIILPYHDRIEQLRNTLASFKVQYKGVVDFEIVIVEDCKNAYDSSQHKLLYELCLRDYYDLNILLILEEKCAPNPSIMYNQGVAACHGEWVVLSSPECSHQNSILTDPDICKDRMTYTVCACAALNQNGSMKKWYQHSRNNSKKYHFCSIISRFLYDKVGGFDEEFAWGYCFDDDAFLARVEQFPGIAIVERDDLLVHHQHHRKHKPPKFQKLWEKNKRLFEEKYK